MPAWDLGGSGARGLLDTGSVDTPQVRARARMAAIRRARRAGFTLVELMVVVVLISIIALIATPAMRIARDDRLAFDSARRVEQLLHRARTRAAGRGAAHLFVAEPSGVRGRFTLFEALDGTTGAGPNPVSTCKAAGEWTAVLAFTPGTVDNTARIIDGFDLNSAGVNTNMDLRSNYFVNAVAAPAVVMCVTPGGTTFVGQGATVGAAIIDMQAQTMPFNTYLEVAITRNAGGSPVGLTRRVLAAGIAAPRIKSE
jgi:prepilin-type N-terminal cleavage/methylation domain-containing protein